MKIINYNYLNYLFLFFTILLHLFFLKNFSINLEYQFANLVNYFKNFDETIINEFVSFQANTIVFSFFIYIFSKIFSIDNYLLTGKLLSISSYLLFFFSIINYSKFFFINSKKTFILLFLLFCNPLIWIYGYRSLPDLLPVSLGFFSISLLFDNKKSIFKIFISSILISICGLLKYIFLILLIFGSLIIFFSLKKKTKALGYVTFYNFFPLVFILIYFFWFHSKYGFVISEINGNVIETKFYNYISTFLYYLGFIFIFVTPINIINLNFFEIKYKFHLLIITLIMFYIGYSNPLMRGEMNFGNLFIINTNMLKGLLFALSTFSLITFFLSYNNLKSKIKTYYIYFLITSLLYICILSFYRPAQRYLLVLLPFFYLFFFLQKKKIANMIIIVTIIFFSLINFTLTTYSYYRSKIAEEIINYLILNSIINEVEPGPIADSYNFNLTNNKRYKYKITKTPNKDYIKKFKVGNSILKLDYYLIKI